MRFSLFLLLLAVTLAPAQSRHPSDQTEEPRLPNGKVQKEEILKAEHKKTLQDVTQLAKLAEELKLELEKNDQHVLSLTSLKQIDTIERLTKRIRSRLKRY
ncbi:MAG TPA: hypothetical protein VMZ52_03420 [Bryobacteraceae bacterium]|nr:hypothetical protein [Bryobacteraceae bacterium]